MPELEAPVFLGDRGVRFRWPPFFALVVRHYGSRRPGFWQLGALALVV